VDSSSAQQSARYNVNKVEDANHMEVCKPPSKEHPNYMLLLQFINKCQVVSLDNVGVYLPSPVFSHGQLYVVIS
jgi:hypothetical protein